MHPRAPKVVSQLTSQKLHQLLFPRLRSLTASLLPILLVINESQARPDSEGGDLGFCLDDRVAKVPEEHGGREIALHPSLLTSKQWFSHVNKDEMFWTVCAKTWDIKDQWAWGTINRLVCLKDNTCGKELVGSCQEKYRGDKGALQKIQDLW